MAETTRRSARVKISLPIQVRGMSAQNKFFEENTHTLALSRTEVTTQLANLPELEMEIHLTSLRSGVGGTFRVVWINTRGENGFHSVGLELLEPEGDLWQMDFPPPPAEANGAAPPLWVECRRCHDKVLTMVLEADEEFLCEGFQMSRHCDQCKATTTWEVIFDTTPLSLNPASLGFTPEVLLEDLIPGNKLREEQRTKGRAPIRMRIKVIRWKYDMVTEDVCETQNVSRGGAYFMTHQNYDVGELVKVILPYKEGEAGIPVPARVIRQEPIAGTFYKGVAIRLGPAEK